MKPFLLLAALLTVMSGSAAFCQTAPTGGSTFYAAGITALAQSSPKANFWAIVATPISGAKGIWSLSETDFVPVTVAGKITVQTSARTGFAMSLRQFGSWTLYGLANGGIATDGTNSSGAFAGGGVVKGPFPGQAKWSIILGVRVIKSAIAATVITTSIGVGW